MKALSAAILSLCLTSSAFAASDEGKVTFEKGFESHKKNMQYNSISPEETAETWRLYAKKPETSPSSGGGELKIVWEGSAAKVPVAWDDEFGEYYIELTFNHSNTAGSVWISVDNSTLKKNAAIPSPYNYEANWHILYEKGVFTAKGLGKGSSTPNITRISKFPMKQLNQCSAGTIQSNNTYCTDSNQRTCETGLNQRTCANNGGWMPWKTIRLPSCITGSQDCR